METDVYQCPHCGVTIPDVQDKVALHKTFCKSSYENFSNGNLLKKSTMSGIFELLDIDLKDFPRGVIPRKGEDGQTTITYTPTKIHWPVLMINVIPIYFIFLDKNTVSFYLILPVLVLSGLSIIYFLCNLIYNRYARWVLTFKDGKGTFFSGFGNRGRTVAFEYDPDSTVSVVSPEDLGRGIVEILRRIPIFIESIPVFIVTTLTGQILDEYVVGQEGITVMTKSIKYSFGGNIPNSAVMKYMAAYLLREIAK